MIYYLIATILSCFTFVHLNKRYKISTLELAVITIGLIIFAGIRCEVGYDWDNYEKIFQHTESLTTILSGNGEFFLNTRIEKGYLLLNSFVKLFGDDLSGIMILASVIINVLIIIRIKEYTPYFFISIFLYFVTWYLTFSFGLLRQGIAVALFFYSIKYIKSSEPMKYYIINIIACFFHSSAFLVILFYWLLRSNIKTIVYIFIFALSFALSFFDWVRVLPGFIFAANINDYMSDEVQGAIKEIASLGFILKMLVLVLGIKFREKLEKDYPYYNLMIKIYFYHVVLFLIFRQIFVLGARFPLYFAIVDSILISYFIGIAKDCNLRIVLIFIIILYAFVMLSNILSKGVYIPYQTIFGI